MDNVTVPHKEEDVSSDGEEDFESADEGEGKEKDEKMSNDNVQIEANDSTVQAYIDCDHVNNQKGDVSEGMQSSSVVDSEKESPGSTSKESDLKRSHNIVEQTESEVSLSNNDIGISSGIKNDESSEEKLQSNENSDQRHEGDSGATGSSSWGWGSWGAVLNQATSTMTSGLSQVIEKVETTLGIPEPGELQDEASFKEEKKEVITVEPKSAEIDRGDDQGDNDDIGAESNIESSESFFASWGLASLSNAVTSKGFELVSEGIDALETIGKKTMHVISEGDPGFRAKREMFKKPSLSQVLREAKEESAKETAEKKAQEVLEKVNFNDEFDRCQGLAHLEALEILSRECEAKIESVLIDLFEENLEEAKSKLRVIEDIFGKANQNEEDQDENVNIEFAVEIGKCAMALNLAFVPNKLNQTEESISKWLEECAKDQEISVSSRAPDDIFSHVITSLADITAKSIEVFRKVAEMILLVDNNENTVTAEDRATHLYLLTKVVTNRISSLSTSYAQCLNTAVNETEDNDNITPLITEVYLECSNSSSHVQDSFKLLLPVLQVSALNNMKK